MRGFRAIMGSGAIRGDGAIRGGRDCQTTPPTKGCPTHVVLDIGEFLCGGFLPDSRRPSDYSPNHSKTPVVEDNMVIHM